MKKHPVLYLIVTLVLAWMLIWGCSMALSSCRVIKGKQSVKSDSTAVHKVEAVTKDSTVAGAVSKSDITEMYEKWKATFTFPKDTSVVNIHNYPTETPWRVQPIQVTYEKETGERRETRTDSAWMHQFTQSVFVALDSVNRKLDQVTKSKQSETKGLGLIAVILIGFGILLFWEGAKKIVSKYSIIKKAS